MIKQTIMTTVYGVTRFGARLQIEGQLQDIEEFPQRRVFDASLYLTRKTFDCLQKMFTSTKEIQVFQFFKNMYGYKSCGFRLEIY